MRMDDVNDTLGGIRDAMVTSPLLRAKHHNSPSVFVPAHLLREARRQKGLPDRDVPAVCVLDPDGDLARAALASGRASSSPGWACYHTAMLEWTLLDGLVIGIVAHAVGAPFAVLVAEQLFVSGCRLLISITSAGRIADLGEPPYAVLIDRALRDEGTSHHYLPVAHGDFVTAPDMLLLDRIAAVLDAAAGITVHRGASWTTDAPFRETEQAIADARGRGVLAVEMEAAALYAAGTVLGRPVACFALVTNTMGQQDGDDFEKGEADGTVAALRLIVAAATAFAQSDVSAARV